MMVSALGLLAIIAVIGWTMLPVCAPLTDEQLREMNPPIEQRTDRDFYLQVFQKRDGQWHQCKTRLSRAFFF